MGNGLVFLSIYRCTMMNNHKNKLFLTMGWLAFPFCLFALLLYFTWTYTDWVTGTTTIFLFMPALFLSVVLIVTRRSNDNGKKINLLEEELATLRNENSLLKNQLEENIEKRVYELQVINGALNREIAERTQMEEEVRELQKQLSLILNSAGEGILGLDNSGRVTFLNTAASLMLGWEAEEIIGEKHHALIHHTLSDGSPHPVDQCPIYMAYKDGLVHYKTGDVFWCKNDTSFPVEYSSTPINDQGMLTGAVVVFRDMSTFM